MGSENTDTRNGRKTVYIHIGPHKTGTSGLQAALGHYQAKLQEFGVAYLSNAVTHSAAMALANKRMDDARLILKDIAEEISKIDQPVVLLSHEDFSGDLPGRKGKQVYPTFIKNLRIIKRSFNSFNVRFIFFEREEDAWLRSCYKQIIRYREKYFSFETYEKELGFQSWDMMLKKASDIIGDAFIIHPYNSDPQSGLRKTLETLQLQSCDLGLDVEAPLIRNVSLTDAEIFAYERVNQRAFIRRLIPVYKKRISAYLNGERPTVSENSAKHKDKWPPCGDGGNFIGLERLGERMAMRVDNKEDQPDLLPPVNTELAGIAVETMDPDARLPDISRKMMKDQYKILEYHLRGGSRLAFVNALTISYLRRDTRHTAKAFKLFHRIWQETGHYLVTELSTRWILSTLQTFLDHPLTENQRCIGAAGYFYGNMLKIYEAERALEGLHPDAVYESIEPVTKSGFRGLDRYPLGGTDLLLNTNAMALEISGKDPVAGLVLEELLLRTRASDTVFSRTDKSRQKHHITRTPFENVWSFFEEPVENIIKRL